MQAQSQTMQKQSQAMQVQNNASAIAINANANNTSATANNASAMQLTFGQKDNESVTHMPMPMKSSHGNLHCCQNPPANFNVSNTDGQPNVENWTPK